MILVGVGEFFGALVRFYIGKCIMSTYPWATFIINCSGSFALGFLYGVAPSDWVWKLIGVGFLGAYTTFSTFGFETFQLLEEQRWIHAILYVFSSIILGILSVAIGLLTA